MPKLEFSRADIAELEQIHAAALEAIAKDPPIDDEDRKAARGIDIGLRVLIGLGRIALDREVEDRNAATDALR